MSDAEFFAGQLQTIDSLRDELKQARAERDRAIETRENANAAAMRDRTEVEQVRANLDHEAAEHKETYDRWIEARAEVENLRKAIREHHDAVMDPPILPVDKRDQKLWAVLD